MAVELELAGGELGGLHIYVGEVVIDPVLQHTTHTHTHMHVGQEVSGQEVSDPVLQQIVLLDICIILSNARRTRSP